MLVASVPIELVLGQRHIAAGLTGYVPGRGGVDLGTGCKTAE